MFLANTKSRQNLVQVLIIDCRIQVSVFYTNGRITSLDLILDIIWEKIRKKGLLR